MSFAFRLAPVLQYRKRTEETRALVLAVAQQARAAAAARRAERVREIAHWRDAIRAAGARGALGLEIQDLDEATTAASRAAETAAAELGQADARVEAAREDLLRAARDRRSLERLEEIQRSAHAKLRTRAEQTVLDEVGGVRDAWRRAAAQRETGS